MKTHFLLPLLFISLSAWSQIPNYVPANGLVAWYPFSGNANDESGTGNNGAVNGATLTTDRFGTVDHAYEFAGAVAVGDYIVVPNSSSLNPTAVTINAWINATDSNALILEKSNPSNDTELGYSITHRDEWQGNHGLRTMYGTGNCGTTTNPINWGPANAMPNYEWTMVTVSIATNGEVKQYVNGNLSYTFTDQPFQPCNSATSTLRIGGLHWNNDQEWFNGKIDDIGIWSRVLSDVEIIGLFNADVGDTCVFTVYDTIVTNITVYDTIAVYDTVITYTSTIDTLLIDVPTGLAAPNDNNAILVYPNPAHTHVIINNGSYALLTGYSLKIENSLGQNVFDSPINQQLFDLDLSDWGGNGTYFLSVIDSSGNTLEVRKILLQ